MNYLYDQIYKKFLEADSIVLVSHKNPDADSLGSASALFRHLEARGKKVALFCATPVPEEYNFIYGVRYFGNDPRVIAAADSVCVLDSGDLRVAGLEMLGSSLDSRKIIAIDHHNSHEHYGAIELVDARASSTAEIIYQFLRVIGVRFDATLATSLLAGIISDTSFFNNAATSHSAIAAAGELLKYGAEYNKINRRLFKNKDILALSLWGKALARISYSQEFGLATVVLKVEDFESGSGDEAVEGLTNYLGRVLKASVILLLRETSDGKIKGSLRTVEDIDVSRLARELGGGGHKKAAGFTIPGKLLETEDGWEIIEPEVSVSS